MKYKILIPISIVLLALFAFSLPKQVAENVNIEKSDSVSVFLKGYKYENVDGTQFTFDQVKGKVLLLDFWATWCAPCIKAHPDVVALENWINDSNLQVITISIDKDQSKWKEFFAKNKWTSINIKIDPNDSDNPLNKMVTEKILHNGKTMLKTSVPRYYIIDKELLVEKVENIKSEKTRLLIKEKLK